VGDGDEEAAEINFEYQSVEWAGAKWVEWVVDVE
jgi:hypothetical protein